MSGTRKRFQALVEKLTVEQPAPAIEPPRGLGPTTDVRPIAIAASTGGPAALQRVLAGLPANLSAGVALISPAGVHMTIKRMNTGMEVRLRTEPAGPSQYRLESTSR